MSFLDNVKAVPITDFAQRCGYTLVRMGRYYSLREHDSVRIDTSKNCFWRNSRFAAGFKGGAGSVIDFAIEFGFAKDINDAMRQIALMYGIEGEEKPEISFQKPMTGIEKEKKLHKKGEVELPEKDKDNRCVYAYLLKTRGIEQSVIRYFLGKKMLYQDTHKNCVFHTGTTFGCVRGTDTSKRFVGDLDGCDYDECFFFRGSNHADTLVVAESVIDIMSIMTQFCKEKKRYTDYCYLALAGTGKLSSVFYHVEQEHDKGMTFKKVLIATDNDKWGEDAFLKISDGLEKYDTEYERYIPPQGKDWNEYIVMTKGV